jgi:hypothetical protein
MNRRAIPIGKQLRPSGDVDDIHGDVVELLEPGFVGVTVCSDVTCGGIRCRWDISGDAASLEPHEARALGQALIAAADDVAAYKVQP